MSKSEYDLKDSDTLDDIATKIYLANDALQVAKDAGTRTKPTTFLQTHIQGKIDALETRKKELEVNTSSSSAQKVEETGKEAGSS